MIEDGTIKEVESFCCLGDVLDREGGNERAVRARVAAAWKKWREISSLLCNGGIPLKHRAGVYESCVRSVMTYGSESWAMTGKLESIVQLCDRRMLRSMARVSLRDRVPSSEVLTRCGLKDIAVVMKRNRLRWYGHVMRREEGDPLKMVRDVNAPGTRPRGRPKKTWNATIKEDLRGTGVSQSDTQERTNWREIITRLTP